MGYENSIGQCTIHLDGSGTFRREIKLRAYAVVPELNYYTTLPEKPERGDFVDYGSVRSLDSRWKFEPERSIDTGSRIEVRNRIVPPLLPGESLSYEGVENVRELYAMPPVDMGSRLMGFDYYARDINCPTRRLAIEVLFPTGVEPIDPWSEVWYAVGLSRVPHPDEARRVEESLNKRRLGEHYVLSLEVEFPVLGLTYVVAWRPDLLIDQSV
jgi:hypothetical protein